jgi:predicted transcriptional regulator
MLGPIHGSLPSLIGALRGADVRVLREANLGDIIPDLLVGASRGPNWKAYRSTRMEAHIMAFLEREHAMSMDQITEAMFISPADLQRALEKLAGVGVVRCRSGTWRLSRPHRSKRFEVVAIEVKLSRWRDALCQAIEYLEFADRSYVVLDGNRVNETPIMREAFALHGIGLFLQYGFSTISSVDARRNRPPSSVSRVQAVAKLFGSSSADSRRLSWGSGANGLNASATLEKH